MIVEKRNEKYTQFICAFFLWSWNKPINQILLTLTFFECHHFHSSNTPACCVPSWCRGNGLPLFQLSVCFDPVSSGPSSAWLRDATELWVIGSVGLWECGLVRAHLSLALTNDPALCPKWKRIKKVTGSLSVTHPIMIFSRNVHSPHGAKHSFSHMRDVRTSILSPRWHASNGEHTVSLGVWNCGKTFEACNFLFYSKVRNDSGFLITQCPMQCIVVRVAAIEVSGYEGQFSQATTKEFCICKTNWYWWRCVYSHVSKV